MADRLGAISVRGKIGFLGKVFILFCALACWSTVADARSTIKSIFSVTANTDTDQVRRGSGLVIARNGWILTSAKLVESGAVTISSGAIGTLDAEVVGVDAEADLALLRVKANPSAIVFAARDAKTGDVVSSLGYGAQSGHSSHGAMGDPLAGSEGVMTHNALFGSQGYGGALVNECGEVVGLNRTNPFVAGDGLAVPRGYGVSDTIERIKAFAARYGVAILRSATTCVPALVRATGQAAVAQARASAAEQKAAKLETSEIFSEQEKINAQQRAKNAEDAREAAEHEAELRQKAAQAAKIIAQRMRKLSFWGAVIAAGLLLVIGAGSLALILRSRKKRRHAEDAAQMAREQAVRATTAPAGAQDLLLEGTVPDGEPFAIKVPALTLGEAHGGAIMGRNPESSEFVINREKISRRHCRLFVENATIRVEDLGSTNGTSLNGRKLSGPTEIHDGDMILIGDVSLRVVFRGSAQ